MKKCLSELLMADFLSFKMLFYIADYCFHPKGLRRKDTAGLEQILYPDEILHKYISFILWVQSLFFFLVQLNTIQNHISFEFSSFWRRMHQKITYFPICVIFPKLTR